MRSVSYTLVVAAFVATAMADWTKYGPEYEKLSASAKHSTLMTEIQANQSPNKWYNPLEFAGIFVESMTPSLQWVGDTFENGWFGPRSKYIHTVGSTASVKFVHAPNTAGYTGIFEGADYGIIRMSCAIEPDYKKTSAAGADGNFVPGFGLKFLRDGMQSANLVAMYGVDGQPSWNFFKMDFSNHLAADPKGAGQQALAAKFKTATPLINYVGLSDMASYDQHGHKAQNPVFPFELIFEPNSDLRARFSDDFQAPFQEQLGTIKSGQHLYKVYAKSSPTASKEYIGDLVLTSDLKASYFGDKYLFFRHQDMQEDIKLRPDWKQHVHLESSKPGCPFTAAKSYFQMFYQYFGSIFQLF